MVAVASLTKVPWPGCCLGGCQLRYWSVESAYRGPGMAADEAVMLGPEQAAVLEALRLLPGRQRQVMAWAYDGYTPAEIATFLRLGWHRVIPGRRTAPSRSAWSSSSCGPALQPYPVLRP